MGVQFFMNDRSLNAFITVSENGSFYKASQVLYTSPQSLMMQVNQLESELGFQLLKRSPKGVKLTEAGMSFLLGAKELIDLAHSTVESSRKLAVDPNRVLKVGLISTPFLMQDACLAFSVKHPEIHLHFVKTEQQTWLSLLSDGAIDIAEMVGSKDLYGYDVLFFPVTTDTCSVILSPHHSLAQKERLSIDDLISQDIFVSNLSWFTSLKEELHQLSSHARLHELPCERQTVYEVCFNGDVYLAQSRYAYNFVPLIARPLDIDLSWEFGFVYRKKHSAIVDQFLEISAENWGNRFS